MSYPYEFPGAFRYPPFQPSQKLKDSMYLTLRAELRRLDEQIREVAASAMEIDGFHGGVSNEEEDNHRRREVEHEKDILLGKHAMVQSLLAPFICELREQHEEFDRRQCDAMMAL